MLRFRAPIYFPIYFRYWRLGNSISLKPKLPDLFWGVLGATLKKNEKTANFVNQFFHHKFSSKTNQNQRLIVDSCITLLHSAAEIDARVAYEAAIRACRSCGGDPIFRGFHT